MKNFLMNDETCWMAIVQRDRAANGCFYYSVRTTGVFCRPSCPARLPRRENVRFHKTYTEAQQAGFRPCQRCKPDQLSQDERYTAMVIEACRLIESADDMPSLETLAEAVGMSRYHFHRIFKAIAGVTPKAYGVAHRTRRVREQIAQRKTVTEAIYSAGFNSNGRFYAASSQILGMTPSDFRAGGINSAIRFAVGECSLGSILVAATAKGICAILLGDDPNALVENLQERFPRAELTGGDKDFEQWIAKVVGFVEAPSTGFDLPLDVRGTAFQQRVWQALREVPVGSTVSYAQIAERLGSPKAVRAVAQACAANTIAVAIPCHRVIRNDGALSGYRWGVERKQALLQHEAKLVERMNLAKR